MAKVIRRLNRTSLSEVRLIHKNPDKVLKKFLKKLPNVIAGGGKVYNDKGEILFIYRNDKWDLPKGKIEKGEGKEEAAIREVEEECGVEVLLKESLGSTWHTYPLKDKIVIKRTYWYWMTCENDRDMKPSIRLALSRVKERVSSRIRPIDFLSRRELREDSKDHRKQRREREC